MATAKKIGQATSSAKKQNIDGNFKDQSPTKRQTANDYMHSPEGKDFGKGTKPFTGKLGTN